MNLPPPGARKPRPTLHKKLTNRTKLTRRRDQEIVITVGPIAAVTSCDYTMCKATTDTETVGISSCC